MVYLYQCLLFPSLDSICKIYLVINAYPWYYNNTDPVHAYITFVLELSVHVVRVEQLHLRTTTTANAFSMIASMSNISQKLARSVVLFPETPSILGSNIYRTKFAVLQPRCSTFTLLRWLFCFWVIIFHIISTCTVTLMHIQIFESFEARSPYNKFKIICEYHAATISSLYTLSVLDITLY